MTEVELKALYHLAVADMLQGEMVSAEKKFDDYIEVASQIESSDKKELLNAYVNKLHLSNDDQEKNMNIAINMNDRFYNTELGAEVLKHLAQFHHIQGDLEHQGQALRSLVEQFPEESSEQLLDLGLLCLTQKNVSEAVVYLTKYLNQGNAKNKVIAAVNLAECYNALNSPKEAQVIIERYMK